LQATVSAGIRPLPAHHNPSAMLLLDFAGNRQCRQARPDLIFCLPHDRPRKSNPLPTL